MFENDNLEAQAELFFSKSINSIEITKAISTFGDVITGKTPPTSISEFYGDDIPFIKTPDMHHSVYVTTSQCYLSKKGANSQNNKYIPSNSVIVACIGANAGEVALTSYVAQTNQQINAVITDYPCFLYFSIKTHTDELRSLGDGSSTMLNINKSSFENYAIPTPNTDSLQLLENRLKTYFDIILSNSKEIDVLNGLKALMIAQLSR